MTRRYLPKLASGLSLLLFAALAVVWVRSYLSGDKVGYRVGGTKREEISLSCFSGQLARSRSVADVTGPAERGWFRDPREPHRPGYDMGGGFAGFEYRRVAHPGRWLWEFRAPMWAVAGVLAAAPILQVARWGRGRTSAGKLCPTCGYDLRATPERCPECGTIPAR